MQNAWDHRCAILDEDFEIYVFLAVFRINKNWDFKKIQTKLDFCRDFFHFEKNLKKKLSTASM